MRSGALAEGAGGRGPFPGGGGGRRFGRPVGLPWGAGHVPYAVTAQGAVSVGELGRGAGAPGVVVPYREGAGPHAPSGPAGAGARREDRD